MTRVLQRRLDRLLGALDHAPRSLSTFAGCVAMAALLVLNRAAFGPPALAASASGSCPGSLQALVDAAPAGSTLIVPPCVYRETVTVSKPLTIEGAGATIDGRDENGTVRRDTWMMIEASNVTVSGFTMRYADNQPQTGALRVTPGVSGVVVRDCDLSYATGENVALGTANHSTLSGCAVHDAGELGVQVGGDGVNGLGNTIQGNRIYHNNTAGFDVDWEAGGLKATQQTDLTVADNMVYDNSGPGLWCDIYCRDATFRDNTVYDNSRAGIQIEVSTGGQVTGNHVWSNGWADTDWCWSAGILLSSSGSVSVTDNVVAWNAAGISVVSQDRQDWVHDATGIRVADNTVAATAGRWLECWAQDWNGELFLGASANHGQDDRFWAATRDMSSQFAWDGAQPSLAAFSQTPGGVGARYLSDAEMATVLGAANVPTSPSGVDTSPALADQLVQKAVDHPLGLIAAVAAVAAVAVSGLVLWRRRRAGFRGPG